MKKIEIQNTNGEILNMELAFSFICKENSKNYVALVNNDSIFETNSRYANIDIFEIKKNTSTQITVSDILESEWPLVKKSLQFDVFAKLK